MSPPRGLFFLLPLTVSAGPLGVARSNSDFVHALKDSIFCEVNNKLLDALIEGPVGTPYYSSFLGVPAVTVIAIITTTAVPTSFPTIYPGIGNGTLLTVIPPVPAGSTSTCTLTDMVYEEVTVTNVVTSKTETTTITQTPTEILSCLTAAFTADASISVGIAGPTASVGLDIGADIDGGIGGGIGGGVGVGIGGGINGKIGGGIGSGTGDIGADIDADVGADVGADAGATAGGDIGLDMDVGKRDGILNAGVMAGVDASKYLLNAGTIVQKAACIPPSWNTQQITKACGCVSFPQATLTLTVTAVPAITPPVALPHREAGAGVKYVHVTETLTNTISKMATATVTVTQTATAATVTAIAPNGLDHKRFTHTVNAAKSPCGFTPDFFKGVAPEAEGVLSMLSWQTSGDSSMLTLPWEKTAFDAAQAAVLAQGFFVAPMTGVFTLSSSAELIDNYGYLWLGDEAFCDWSEDNAVFGAIHEGKSTLVSGSTTITLNAGDAVLLSWLWVNGGGADAAISRLLCLMAFL